MSGGDVLQGLQRALQSVESDIGGDLKGLAARRGEHAQSKPRSFERLVQ
jgi:hypothetical protein